MIRGLNKVQEFGGLGYVASTYTSHPDGAEAAYDLAKRIAADLISAGLVVFVPVAYGPGIEREITGWLDDKDYIQSHEFWMAIDERFYSRCDYMIIAMTPGWENSTGMAIEMFDASRRHMPIYFYDPDGQHIYAPGEISESEKFRDALDGLARKAVETGIPHYMPERIREQGEIIYDSIVATAEGLLSEIGVTFN